MKEGYIEEKEWFKCTIDDITYDCYLEYRASIHLSKPWVDVTVIKYTQKKWWFIKWTWVEFEWVYTPNITVDQYRLINDNFYFKSEHVKSWVEYAIMQREHDILREKAEIEKEKNLKVLKEI